MKAVERDANHRGESLLWAPGRKYRACVKVTAAEKGAQPTHSLTSLSSPQNVNRSRHQSVEHQGQGREEAQGPQLLADCGREHLLVQSVGGSKCLWLSWLISAFLGQSRPSTSITIFHHGRRFSFSPSHQTAREKWEKWNHLSASLPFILDLLKECCSLTFPRNADIPSHISSGYQ